MKTKLLIIAILAMFIGINQSAQSQTTVNGKKVLVVYFSWSKDGNTRNMAKQIQAATGADIFKIVPVSAYPINYKATVDKAKDEINRKHKPAIKGTVANFESYDVIIIGSPNWWSTIAPPVATFLSKYNFKGKTIMPFITHEGSRMGRAATDIKELCPGVTVDDGLAVRGSNVSNESTRNDINKWLRDNNVIK